MTATLAIPDAECLSLEEYFEREWSAIVQYECIGGQSIPMTYATENHGLVEHYVRQDDGAHWLFAYAVVLGRCYWASRLRCARFMRWWNRKPTAQKRGAANDLTPDASSFSKHNTYAHITYLLALRLFRHSSCVGANRFRLGN